jgi:hypothetical protein
MMFRIIFLAAVLLPIVAVAHEPTLIVTKAGVFTLSFGEDGVPSVAPYTGTIIKPDGTTPDDPPPPGETPVDQIAEWAAQVDDKLGATALATIYREINKALIAGTITEQEAVAAIKSGTDQVLDAIGGTTRWKDFRSKISKLVSDSVPGTPLTDMFTYIQQGLEQAYE